MRRSKRFQGRLLWYYLLFYSTARFVIEFFRADPRGWLMEGTLSSAQAIGILAASLAIYMLLKRNPPQKS